MEDEKVDSYPTSNESITSFSSKGNRLCAICERKAEGRHYGIISCSACKSFFRRSIAYRRKYQCKFSNNCSIERNGQSICRSCRFSKCFTVGMDPLGIYDYTVKKALQSNGPLAATYNYSLESFKDQITNTYAALVQERRQQQQLICNFSNTMKNVPTENVIFKQFLVNAQLMDYFSDVMVKKKRILRAWCVLQLLHNTVKLNGLQQGRMYHFDCSYTSLTKEGFIAWFNSSKILFPHKIDIQRLSQPLWERVIEIIKHFQKLKLKDFEMGNFLVLAVATSIIQNSVDSKNMRALISPYINRIVQTFALHYCQDLSNDEIAIKIGTILTFLSTFTEMEIIMNEFFLQLSLYCKYIPELFDFNE